MKGGEKMMRRVRILQILFFIFYPFFYLTGFFVDEEEVTNKPELRRIMAEKLCLSPMYVVSKNCRFQKSGAKLLLFLKKVRQFLTFLDNS